MTDKPTPKEPCICKPSRECNGTCLCGSGRPKNPTPKEAGGNPPEELNRNHQIGDFVKWQTIGGAKFEGILQEWDSNVAIVKLSNTETLKAIEC